jgi:hypothetical protein
MFAPLVSPVMQGLSPLLSGYAASPLRGGVEALSGQLRGAAPPLLRELLPLLDQLQPLTLDVAAGRYALNHLNLSRSESSESNIALFLNLLNLTALSSRPRRRRPPAWCGSTTRWRARC